MKELRTTASNREWIALATVYVIWGSTYLGIAVAGDPSNKRFCGETVASFSSQVRRFGRR